MKLSISEAARRAGVERPTLYRKIKSGLISKEIGPDGKPVIDLSELARLYPGVTNRDTVSQYTTSDTSEQANNTLSDSALQMEVKMLREQVTALQTDKEWLKGQLEAQTRLLSDQSPKGGFWSRLRGR